jgi:C-terminal processing protease CtpA/Prc
MRGYPVGGNMLLGQILARKRTAFARLYFPEYDGATGTFRTREELQYLDPLPGPAFEGPIVMLVHGGTQSAAEHTSLIMEAVRDVIFVGSPSSGADGNITYTVLPGGISVGFTGMGVRHGDGRQLQRMGIQPHVTARPTLSGIRSGRDEVLEKAVEVLRSRTDRNNEDMN